MRRTLISTALVLSAAWSSALAQPTEPLKLATFNVGWLWDKPLHDRWATACKAVGWNSDGLPPEQAKKLEGLPYCNVHNGLKWPPAEKCPSLSPADLAKRPLVDDKACRETKDLVDWSSYEEKLTSLRKMIQALADSGVTMIALQEVYNAGSVRQILPRGWEVRTSAEDPRAPKIPQHVGVAWKVSAHAPKDWGLNLELSSAGSRPLRPGLIFTDNFAGKPVQYLVVHLKSGCSNPSTVISDPQRDREKQACPDLERQVPVLEKWVDDRVGKDFVILGDFNRRMTFEKKATPDTGRRENPKISQLFPELNDNDPPGSKLWIAQPARTPEGKTSREGTCSNGHPSIDHIVLSESLYRRISMGPLQAVPITTDGTSRYKAGQQPFVAAPTDHCPHVVEIRAR